MPTRQRHRLSARRPAQCAEHARGQGERAAQSVFRAPMRSSRPRDADPWMRKHAPAKLARPESTGIQCSSQSARNLSVRTEFVLLHRNAHEPDPSHPVRLPSTPSRARSGGVRDSRQAVRRRFLGPPCGLRAVDFLRERGTGRVHRSRVAPDRARPSAPDASPVGNLPRRRPDFPRERCPGAVNAAVLEPPCESPVQRTGGNE